MNSLENAMLLPKVTLFILARAATESFGATQRTLLVQ